MTRVWRDLVEVCEGFPLLLVGLVLFVVWIPLMFLLGHPWLAFTISIIPSVSFPVVVLLIDEKLTQSGEQ